MMNSFDLVKIGAGAVIVAGAYFFGLHNGQNSEQLKMARTQNLQLQSRTMRHNTKIRQSLSPRCVLLNLTLALTLSACAPASPVLKKEPRALPIETQFDVLSWEQNVDDYCKRFEDLLNTVEKRYSSQ